MIHAVKVVEWLGCEIAFGVSLGEVMSSFSLVRMHYVSSEVHMQNCVWFQSRQWVLFSWHLEIVSSGSQYSLSSTGKCPVHKPYE